ncbi:hypothetical protein IEQ34_004573 [Dendrobium chrysotoxum]|uniref:Uncharacterized protein n=1 Tax=Dendrobium chrysotoxum TaxID=161865 RepID=A0AAV7HGS3_DENCH|nr:hypothetical protein IEQ34_004573 [Dendrobium chrysotoxum]
MDISNNIKCSENVILDAICDLSIKWLLWKFRGNHLLRYSIMCTTGFLILPCTTAIFLFKTCVTSEKSLLWCPLQRFKESQLLGMGSLLIFFFAWKNEWL